MRRWYFSQSDAEGWQWAGRRPEQCFFATKVQLCAELVIRAEGVVRNRSLLGIPIPYLITHHRACTCPGEDHPGPVNNIGRGAPEIDVLEAEKNKAVSSLP
jgi:hypothetical protein